MQQIQNKNKTIVELTRSIEENSLIIVEKNREIDGLKEVVNNKDQGVSVYMNQLDEMRRQA